MKSGALSAEPSGCLLPWRLSDALVLQLASSSTRCRVRIPVAATKNSQGTRICRHSLKTSKKTVSRRESTGTHWRPWKKQSLDENSQALKIEQEQNQIWAGWVGKMWNKSSDYLKHCVALNSESIKRPELSRDEKLQALTKDLKKNSLSTRIYRHSLKTLKKTVSRREFTSTQNRTRTKSNLSRVGRQNVKKISDYLKHLCWILDKMTGVAQHDKTLARPRADQTRLVSCDDQLPLISI